ncbi:MAG: LysM peptidoglycan-binding domain-containing protein [Chthoniobacteraceae bacterium]
MKKLLQQFRRLFVRTKNYNASLARPVSQSTYDEDDDGNRLSGAFIVVLLLHIIAVVGVFAFARIKENRTSLLPAEPSTQTAASKTAAAKPAPPVVATAPAPAASLVPAVQTLKSPQTGPRPAHVVKPGETLTKIAFAYGVSVNDLVTLNRLKSQDDIQVGQAIALPENKPAAKPVTVADAKAPAAVTPGQKQSPAARDKRTTKNYFVKAGDTVVKIARENGCTYEELVKLNNIKDPKKIVPGQVIKLPPRKG